ncbi:MAG: PEP-CTERM sorting domain-containing protein [Verrucomicrobia bacterium]|jgi:hypothetical protein|nr:PEP-CTERM sorting domain-containing protein [Verrucomicrobiota bacterium]
MTAEVNVSGSAQLWSADEEAVLTVQFLNTLEAVPEMGWDETVAAFADSSPLWYYDYDYTPVPEPSSLALLGLAALALVNARVRR